MAIFYVSGCIILLLMNASGIPATLQLIFHSAFSGQAMFGGFAGATMKEAIRYGVARGLFSNESGLGSAPIVAAAAQTKNPVRQALVSSTGTFWDTVVVCAMTGLVLVNSGDWTKGLKGAALTKAAFADFPIVGPIVLTVGPVDICLFHDPWMVVLRRESGRIPPWPQSGSSLSLAVGWRCDAGRGSFAPDGLVACRRHKRPDGNSKPDFTARPQWRYRR
jgi:hypothetical protein